MKEEQTISWIFLATALASKTRPSDSKEISSVADGINHAVPTHQELELSLIWLNKNGLVTKLDNKYELTQKGKMKLENASTNTKTLFKILEILEFNLKNLA